MSVPFEGKRPETQDAPPLRFPREEHREEHIKGDNNDRYVHIDFAAHR